MSTFLRRLLSVLFACVLVVYVAYQVYQMTYTSVEVTDAIQYTVYDTVDTEAFIVRDETVVKEPGSGYIYYTLENGNRVAKNGEIARVFPSQTEALTQQMLNRLDAQIDVLQAIEAQGSYNRTNLELINGQLASTLKTHVSSCQKRQYKNLADTQFELLQLFCKQQLTTGTLTSLTDRIQSLKEQRQTLSKQYTPSKRVITAPVAGYFISRTDGFEGAVDSRTVGSLTPAQVTQLLTQSASTTSTDTVGKVAGDYQWFLTCVLKKEQTTGIGVGKSLSVRLPFVSAESIPVTVDAVNKDRDGNAAVVLKCIYMSKELADIRHETMQIQLASYTGLYVQDSALQFNADNEAGVFVRVGNTCVFRKVKVLYHSDSGQFSVCDAKAGDGYLELYDDIIVKGKGLYDGKIIR